MSTRAPWEHVPKDYRPWVKAAVVAGWTYSRTRQGHVKLTSPDGSYSTPVSGTSSDPRMFKAFTLRLRKRGVAA